MMRLFKWCAEPFAGVEDTEIIGLALLAVLAIAALFLIASRIEAVFALFDFMDGGLK